LKLSFYCWNSEIVWELLLFLKKMLFFIVEWLLWHDFDIWKYETVDPTGTRYSPETRRIRAWVWKSSHGYGTSMKIYPHPMCWWAGIWSIWPEPDPLPFLVGPSVGCGEPSIFLLITQIIERKGYSYLGNGVEILSMLEHI
jgi:hypothetical protein